MPDIIQEKSTLSDNEFLIMTEIVENDIINQRTLSKKLGISLGTINTLINKMAREGKIKIEQVSSKQVAYMLTPAGMMEKAKKTVRYLKHHYRVIYETKEKIKSIIDTLALGYEDIYILKYQDEIGAIIDVAVSEYNETLSSIKLIIIDDPLQILNRQEKHRFAVINATEDSIDFGESDFNCKIVDMIKEI